MPSRDIPALAIFILTYVTLAAGKLPRLRIDRCGAALIGAVAMVVSGTLSERAALAAIDFRTLGLLLGMMILIANLRLSGAFAWLAWSLFGRARGGFGLLALTVALAGVLAAFFVNDVVCLVLAPLLIDSAAAAGLEPAPLLLGLATASNVGSAATLTGNPQNMIVAGFANLGYGQFAAHLAPGAMLGLLVVYAVIAFVYRRALAVPIRPPAARGGRHLLRSRPLALKAGILALGTLLGFGLGLPTALVALSAAALSLITRRIRPQRIYREVDWTMLLMFSGLFVVIGGVQAIGLAPRLLAVVSLASLTRPWILTALVAVLSNLVSNVPAVMLFRPLLAPLRNSPRLAMLLAAASTYAGNLTLLGSMANLIVIESARRRGVRIGFWEYFLVGFPIAAITLVIGVATL